METQRTILIVDQEPDFTAGLQEVLAAGGYHVVIARSRTQAEEMAQAERPDAVLLGTVMPRGDAFKLHQWLKQNPRFETLPMIVIDAPWEKQLLRGWTREEGLQLDADDYLLKPVAPAALLPLIESLLHKAVQASPSPAVRTAAAIVANSDARVAVDPARAGATPKTINVLVVDDHAIIREGIRALLALQKDVRVVGEAVDGLDALEKTRRLSPDVVLMDIAMPVMNGLEATQRICKEHDQTKVLMLTQHDNEESVLASTRVGALGFIPKTSASSELLAGIRSVFEGKRYIFSAAT